jgi:hypothetical protein
LTLYILLGVSFDQHWSRLRGFFAHLTEGARSGRFPLRSSQSLSRPWD